MTTNVSKRTKSETTVYKIKKRSKLRYNEYYDMQETFDKLYEDSGNGKSFNKLYEIITSSNNILLAYRSIKRNTGSKTKGDNGYSIKDIEKWTTEQTINYVRNRLSNYSPHKVRRVEIPKENDPTQTRPLGIPSIQDRLIQQCILQVLEPICEAKFYAHSYGFRPNRSCKHAIARSASLVNKAQLQYVVDIDIKGFFDNVNHGKLLRQIYHMGIQDKRLLCIISKMLKSEIVGVGIPSKGVPQGGILSPLLSNIVLNELDQWVSSQWETFPTQHNYSQLHKYKAIKKTNLKEIWIVRYADDFKIFCRTMETANKTYIAVQKWLHERLKLQVNENKSKVVDLLTGTSDFLGFELMAKEIDGGKNQRKPRKMKKKNYKQTKKRIYLYTKVSRKAMKKIKHKLKEGLKEIQHSEKAETVNKYNSIVLGEQQYYNIACNVSRDFARIGWEVDRVIYNRLRKSSKAGKRKKKQKKREVVQVSKTYKKFYGDYHFRKRSIAGILLFPIAGVKQSNPMNFSQNICNFTATGRKLIHDNLNGYNISVLRYLMNNPVKGMTIEYNDNRQSLYTGQNGLCGIMGTALNIKDIHCHHIIPKGKGFNGSDKYDNLILINSDAHNLIHAVDQKIITKYLTLLTPNKQQLAKINKLREKVGNTIIS